VLLAAAYVVFVVDGTRVIAGGPLAAASLGQVIGAADPAGLAAFNANIMRIGGEWLWQPVVGGLLAAPAFAVLAIAAILLMFAGRRRAPHWRTAPR